MLQNYAPQAKQLLSQNVPSTSDFTAIGDKGAQIDKLHSFILSSNVYKDLFLLQVQQYHHDKNYHREIQALTVHHRLNHFALHFAKYVGRLAESLFNEDSETYQQTITDFFIISLAAANTLNLNLSEEFQKILCSSESNFAQVTSILLNKYQLKLEDPLFIIKSFTIYTGRLAKACESIDHLEKYSFREVISEYVTYISMQAVISASVEGIDLSQSVPNRLGTVKERFIFHSILNGI